MNQPHRIPVVLEDLRRLLEQAQLGAADPALIAALEQDMLQQVALIAAGRLIPSDVHWNSETKLPLVDVSLMLKLSDAVYAIGRRTQWASTKNPDALQFVLEDGVEIHGKFPWTYV